MLFWLKAVQSHWYLDCTAFTIVRIDPETPAASPESLEDLISKLAQIRASLISHESDLEERASTIHPAYRKSAINLIHYMALSTWTFGCFRTN